MKKLLSLVAMLALLGTGTALAKEAAPQKAAPATKVEEQAPKAAEQADEKAPEAATTEPAAEEAAQKPAETEKK